MDYGTVLALADLATHGRGGAIITSIGDVRRIDEEVLHAVNAAARQFRDIREGRIDWQTGDPIPAFQTT